VYAHHKIKASFRIYDARNNTWIFTDDITAYNRNIAPAMSPLGIVTSLVQTIWHMRSSEKVDTYDRLARRVMEDIPEPDYEPASQHRIESINVVIPGAALKPGDLIAVTMKGNPGKRAEFDIGNMRKNIPMAEKAPGIYEGTYRIAGGDNIEFALIRCRLHDQTSATERIHRGISFRVDSTPPRTPRIMSIRSTKKDFEVFISEPEDPDFDHFRLYGSLAGDNGFMNLDHAAIPYFPMAELDPGRVYHFRVSAVDALGNESALSEDYVYQAPPRGPTRIEKDFTKDGILSRISSPYLVEKAIRLPVGFVLTVEPGVEVRFGSQGSFIIEGEIIIMGEEYAPVLFTGEEDWPGIQIRSRGKQNLSRLAHATFRNGRYGLALREGGLEGHNLTFLNCKAGMTAEKGTSVRIVDSVFQHNTLGIRSEADRLTLKNISFIKNTFTMELDGAPRRQEESREYGFNYSKR